MAQWNSIIFLSVPVLVSLNTSVWVTATQLKTSFDSWRKDGNCQRPIWSSLWPVERRTSICLHDWKRFFNVVSSLRPWQRVRSNRSVSLPRTFDEPRCLAHYGRNEYRCRQGGWRSVEQFSIQKPETRIRCRLYWHRQLGLYGWKWSIDRPTESE